MNQKLISPMLLCVALFTAHSANAVTAAQADCEYGLDQRTDSIASCSGANRSGLASIPDGEVGVFASGTLYPDMTSEWGTVDAAWLTNISVVDTDEGLTGSYDFHVTGMFSGVGGSDLEARMRIRSSIDEVSLRLPVDYDGSSVIFGTPDAWSGTVGPLGDPVIDIISSTPGNVDFWLRGIVDVDPLNLNVSVTVGLNALGNADVEGTSTVDFASTGTLYISDIDFTSETGELFTARAPAVPLPAAVWLFCSGLAGLIGLARCRQFNIRGQGKNFE